MECKVDGDPGDDTAEMGFKVSDGHLCGLVVVSARWNELHLHFVLILYDCFRGFEHFIIEDVFFWYDTCLLEAEHQHMICLVGFSVVASVDGLNEDGVAIDIDHYHDVFVTSSGSLGDPPCLIRKDDVLCIVDLGMYLAHFPAA